MKKLFRSILLVLVWVLLAACFLMPESKKISNYWILNNLKTTEMSNGKISEMDLDYYNDFDDNFTARIIYISDDSLLSFQNDINSEEYYSSGSAIVLTEDSLSSQFNQPTAYAYSIMGDELYLVTGNYDHEGNMIEEYMIICKRYKASFPPENWVSLLADDEYEPDSVFFTPLLQDEKQKHTLTKNESDRFIVTLEKDHEYLFKLRSKVDLYLKLSAHHEFIDIDDNNDDDYPTADPLLESIINWTADADGEYLIAVSSFENKCGYYEISYKDITPSLAKAPVNDELTEDDMYEYLDSELDIFNLLK